MQWRKGRASLDKLLNDLPAYLSGKITDPTGEIKSMYREMGREALAIVHEAFLEKAKERVPDAAGEYWQDVTEYTLRHSKNKERRLQSPEEAEPLIDSERLVKSLDPDAPTGDTVLEETDNGVRGGTSVPYAERHQLGLLSSSSSVLGGGVEVPIRKIIPDWDDWPEAWKDRILEKMHEGVQRFLEAMAVL